MKHLHDLFDYDHDEGCLRWKARNDDYVVVLPSGKVESAISPKSRVRPGDEAGTVNMGDYKITHRGETTCGLRAIWQHVTGELYIGRVRTIKPKEINFKIDNLYLVPASEARVKKDRARNSVVVSYSYEQKQFTVVDVDNYYNKTVLSYHDNIDDAIRALDEPVVSFL